MAEYDTKNMIIEYLNDCNTSISLFKLKNSTFLNTFPSSDIDCALSDLLTLGHIVYTPEGISLQPKTLKSMIDKIREEDIRFIVSCYFNGNRNKNIAREEVKRTIKFFLKGRPKIDEDNYRKIFRSYKFDQISFTSIFEEPTSTYLYLKETCKKGMKDWREIRYDSTQTENIRSSAIALMISEGVMINNELISFSPKEVALQLLKTHKISIKIKDFYNIYSDFIAQSEPIPSGLEMRFSQFSKMITAADNIISGEYKKIRYRPTNKTRDTKLINKLKLHSYRNQYLSASIIFRDSFNIINEADLIDSFELYDFLKKHPEIITKYQIQFSAPRFLCFGNGDTKKQLRELLKEHSPISGSSLAEIYEFKYGLKINTVKTTLFPEISKFLRDGMYDVTTRTITDKQFDRLSNQLNKPWYFVAEVEVLFKRRVGKLYKEYMSTKNLKKLDYKMTSTIIYSIKYSSLFDCLNETAWQGNTFFVSDELWNIPQVQTTLTQKAAGFTIIEYSPQRFIRLSSLKKNGIHKKDLLEIIDIIHKHVSEESYFTLKSLRDNGFSIPLENLGFDDTFYCSILKQSKRIQTRKVANTYLFRKSKKDATIQDFIEYLLSQLKSVDIFDFIDILYENYGISLNSLYIRNLINSSEMYYDSITEKIYIDYDEYFEEV